MALLEFLVIKRLLSSTSKREEKVKVGDKVWLHKKKWRQLRPLCSPRQVHTGRIVTSVSNKGINVEVTWVVSGTDKQKVRSVFVLHGGYIIE